MQTYKILQLILLSFFLFFGRSSYFFSVSSRTKTKGLEMLDWRSHFVRV
ncbi:hypothetical protein CKA32_000607 [Geitlerinema sp. FC II]|nr:hypothetical protein CKA32_000607 [Geitlerinema sp. FC II]